MTPLSKTLCLLALAALLPVCARSQPAPHPPVAAASAPARDQMAANFDQNLGAYDWELTAAFDARHQRWQLPKNRPAPRLQFAAGQLAIRNLCNALSASYRLTGQGEKGVSEGSFSRPYTRYHVKVSAGVMTKRLCLDAGLMALEQRVAAQLPQVELMELTLSGIDDAALWLLFTDHTIWILRGTPTPATRYGSPGERVFLEVAPETVPCGQPRAQCLLVRRLRYDERGLRLDEGDWFVLQGGIEGFTHEPDFRKVLRVQRFAAPPSGPAAAAAPRPVYVLDMVIEAERVR